MISLVLIVDRCFIIFWPYVVFLLLPALSDYIAVWLEVSSLSTVSLFLLI